MKQFTRAVLYITRKWKRSLILLGIFFFTASLVMIGLGVAEAEETQSEELRGATGVSFSVERNLSTGGFESNEHGSYSTQETISDGMIENIAAIDGIEGYNASIATIITFTDGQGEYLEVPGGIGDPRADSMMYATSCNNSAYNASFLSQEVSLVQGQHLTPEQKNGILISEEMAEKNNLKLGDTMWGVNDPYNNDPVVEFEIVGLFENIADETDERNNYDASSYFSNAQSIFVSSAAMHELLVNYLTDGIIPYESADFFVSDPMELERILGEVQAIDSINWNNFILTANDEVYVKTADAMSDLSSLISTLIIIVVAISTFIIAIILTMQIKGRKKETGILLSIGKSKLNIFLQYLTECLLLLIIALPISFFVCSALSGQVANMLENTANITISASHLITVVVGGVGILILSVAIACVPVMKLKPKQILSAAE